MKLIFYILFVIIQIPFSNMRDHYSYGKQSFRCTWKCYLLAMAIGEGVWYGEGTIQLNEYTVER
jgi:hypothetical protein